MYPVRSRALFIGISVVCVYVCVRSMGYGCSFDVLMGGYAESEKVTAL